MTNYIQPEVCKLCGRRGFAEIILQAGPNPCVSPPLACPKCNGGDWGLWDVERVVDKGD